MYKKIGATGSFSLIIVVLTILYFAVPAGTIGRFSISKHNLAPKQAISAPIAAGSQVSAPSSDPVAGPAEAYDVPTAPIPPENLGKVIKVPVLMYHHVADLSQEERAKNPLASDLTVSLADFESQVKYFYDLGYHSITSEQLYNALTQDAALPLKPIVFTFDDGYLDDFQNAEPILEKYGYTGSFAIATELLGRPSYASWEDIIKADKSGMEILSHTENHLDLVSPKYSEDDLKREIYGSKEKLEAQLGHPVDIFVYPYGHVNDKVAEMSKQAGYKMAFTTAYGMHEAEGKLMYEPRVRVHGVGGLEKLKTLFEPKPLIPHTGPVPTNP